VLATVRYESSGSPQPVFLVGAVGDRLVVAAVFGLGDPIGRKRDLVERGRGAGGR
jgi:hypothetical protein